MNKESLEILKKDLHTFVDKPEIPIYDKVELLINLYHILNNYEENIQVLEEHRRLKLTKEDDE